ncbi:hypothetical protein ACWEO1_27525 [Kitasatospora cineracea]
MLRKTSNTDHHRPHLTPAAARRLLLPSRCSRRGLARPPRTANRAGATTLRANRSACDTRSPTFAARRRFRPRRQHQILLDPERDQQLLLRLVQGAEAGPLRRVPPTQLLALEQRPVRQRRPVDLPPPDVSHHALAAA